MIWNQFMCCAFRTQCGIAAICLTLLLTGCACGRTPPIKGQNAVATLEKVTLGGMEQWILVRGENTDNPILLWLHGGPGAAQTPVARHYNGRLEQSFIVVHWDQRGAGKSNPRDFDENTMTTERFMQDTHELTQILKQRFGKERIFLLGHSWGAQLGLQVAHRWPEDYHAYIGVGQVVDQEKGAELSYQWVLQRAREKGTRRAMRKVEQLGPPPFPEHDRYVALMKLVDSYGGGMDVGMLRMALIAFRAPEYCLGDYVRWLRGANRGSGPMWNNEGPFNAFQSAPELAIPAYFLCGRRDYNTPGLLIEHYCAELHAPAGKRTI